MTFKINPKLDGRRCRPDPVRHRFAVGQFVRLNNGFARTLTPAAIYQITGMLPARENLLQYRIRSDGEPYERVTSEDDLEPVDLSQTNSPLLERTFGHG